MIIRNLRKKGFSTLSAISLFFVGLCIIPCGSMKEARASSVHDQMTVNDIAHDQMTAHGCHGKKLLTGNKTALNEASASCPHCNSEVPVIMQEAKIKYLAPELLLKPDHWQVDTFLSSQKIYLPEDDRPPGCGKYPIHILHSIYII